MSEIVIESYDQIDINDLAAFTGLDKEACRRRLEAYQYTEMADAWHQASPSTPEQMRRFYETTELYIWELTKWHASKGYADYLAMLDSIIERYPPTTHPHVLDYGCGIGTAALRLLQAGYRVTIADVPGVTLRYAEFRLRRNGFNIDVLPVNSNRPHLPGTFDVLVSFDVLEHVPQPDRLMRHLAAGLRPGGVAAVVASFFTNSEFPHHLMENTEQFSSVWPLVVSGCGLDEIGPRNVYLKTDPAKSVIRKLRYWLWTTTGFYIVRVPRKGSKLRSTAAQSK